MDYRAHSLITEKAIQEEAEYVTIKGIASTPKPDRYDDIVDPMGAKFSVPMPLLLQHSSYLPVGQMVSATPKKSGIPFEARIPKVKEAGVVKDRVEEAIHSLKYSLITAVSIGFRAVRGGYEYLENGGIHFKEWEWLELSLVTIPANSDAVISAIKSYDKTLLSASGRIGKGAVVITPPGVAGIPHKSVVKNGAVYFKT